MDDADPGFIVQIDLLREDATYVPAFQVHSYRCRGPKGCCRWWRVKCEQYRGRHFEHTKQKAKVLALRCGVPANF